MPTAARQALAGADAGTVARINGLLNGITRDIQRLQRDAGKSFVSRTQLGIARYGDEAIDVFRVVLANPLTDRQLLREVLREQREIAASAALAAQRAQLDAVLAPAVAV